MTARTLSNWAGLSGDCGAVVWLGSLLNCTGLFAGLLHGGKLASAFSAGLERQQQQRGSNYLEITELQGFVALSAKVAKVWEIDDRVVSALQDVSTRKPVTPAGKLVMAIPELVGLGSVGNDETPVLRRLFKEGAVAVAVAPSSTLTLAVALP